MKRSVGGKGAKRDIDMPGSRPGDVTRAADRMHVVSQREGSKRQADAEKLKKEIERMATAERHRCAETNTCGRRWVPKQAPLPVGLGILGQ